MCCSMRLAVESQEVFESTSRIFDTRSARSDSGIRSAFSHAAMNSSAVPPSPTICP